MRKTKSRLHNQNYHTCVTAITTANHSRSVAWYRVCGGRSFLLQ